MKLKHTIMETTEANEHLKVKWFAWPNMLMKNWVVPGNQNAQAKHNCHRSMENRAFSTPTSNYLYTPHGISNNQTKHNFFHYVYLMYRFAFGFFLNVFFIPLHQYFHFLLNKPQPCQDLWQYRFHIVFFSKNLKSLTCCCFSGYWLRQSIY